jgi:uncharacterized protein (TIGR03382 family)
MKNVVQLLFLLAAGSGSLLAIVPQEVPEIDGGSAATAVMLLGTGLLMLRRRRSH